MKILIMFNYHILLFITPIIFADNSNNLENLGNNNFTTLDYLKHYGYIETNDDSPYMQSENSILRNGLLKFQKAFGLEQTGRYDSATQELMSKPRCGHPDHNPFAKSMEKGPLHIWHKFNLSYAFNSITPDMELPTLRYATKKSFDLWSEVSPFDFYEVNNVNEADIRIGFFSGGHNCDHTFVDDRGGIAHAPSMHPNSTNNYANIHFNEKYQWVYLNAKALENDRNGQVYADYFDTLVHEIGHALGLRHIDDHKDAIMYPFANLKFDSNEEYIHPRLSKYDIEAIRKIYGSRRRFTMPQNYQNNGSCNTDHIKPLEDYTTEEIRNSISIERNISYSEGSKAVYLLKEAFKFYDGFNHNNICRHVVDNLNKLYGSDWGCVSTNGNNYSHYISYEKYIAFALPNQLILIYKIRTVHIEKSLYDYTNDEFFEAIKESKNLSNDEVKQITLSLFFNFANKRLSIINSLKDVTDGLDRRKGREWGALFLKKGSIKYMNPEAYVRFEFEIGEIIVFKSRFSEKKI